MRALPWITPLLLLAGCDLFREIGDTFEGLTNRLVGTGVLLSVAPAPNDDVDLSQTDFDEGTSFTLFLADAAEVADLEEAPVDGAEVSLQGVAATPLDAGVYAIAPGGGLSWQDDATWTARAEVGGGVAEVDLHLPASAEYAPPSQHTTGADLQVDLSSEGFDSVFIVVVDAQSGDVTWSNEPETPREIYDFTRGSGNLDVLVPGDDAFPADSAYLMGIAGMMRSRADDMHELNTALSTFLSGKMLWYPVSTVDIPN